MFNLRFRSMVVIGIMLAAGYVAMRIVGFSSAFQAVETPEESPSVRLAQEDHPTIVKPNDGWLDESAQDDPTLPPSDLRDVTPYLPPPTAESTRRL